MTSASADGVRIRIHHLGGTGPPLVCVHATGFHGRVWEPFVPRLREHFSIVSLDQRGHGDSSKPETGYEWRGFGDDVLAVVDELGLTDPVGIGHSAGAAALVFAETTRPQTFSKLVLMDPVTPNVELRAVANVMENPMAEQARRRRSVWDSPEQMIERLQQRSPLAGWQDDFLRAYVTFGTEQRSDGHYHLKCPPQIEAQVYEMGAKHDGWAKLAELVPPTLFLVGEASHMWMGEQAEAVRGHIPNGQVETSPGGHFFPMEHPDAAVDRILAFLDP